MIPIFALCLYLINIRRKKYFMEHLIHSIHFYTFYIFYIFSVFGVLHKLIVLLCVKMNWLDLVNIVGSSNFIESIILFVFILYLFFSQRELYQEKCIVSIGKSIAACGGIFIITIIYRFILFFIVYYTVKL
jgi:hypothetical protein